MDKKDNNQEKRYPRFLDNKPCGQDLFIGKSHDSVAKNIANIIANNSSNIIGIDGGWGSGKSNMVDLVRKKLNSEKYHFFIYDAWGHQEDLQRRSILEELTSQLTNGDKKAKNKKAVLDETKWKRKLKDLLSKKREVETKTIPKLSCGIILMALAIIATPILDVVSSKIESNLWKVLITSIPFLVVLLFTVVLFIKNLCKYRKCERVSQIVKISLNETFSIYTDKQKEDTTFETISEEEPSSRKFRDWMHEIDNDLDKNIVIVVFDNMDRLPAQKVQELWASIHTFFADENYNNIKALVPFDRQHIITAFKNEDDATGKCFGNDFINKTFDAVYRVSPPIMSDWKDYFVKRWEEAFGTKPDSKVTQIYDILSDSITPREIIAFINEFVSIKQISDESIPDEYIALFIKGKEKMSDNPKEEILNPTYLGAMDFMYKNDPNLPMYMSALYYQLPANKALDIVYTEALKKALDNNEISQIKTLQTQTGVFYPILENAITSITNIPNSVAALNQCFANENNEQTRLAWDCVYKREKEQEITQPLQDYQKILIQHISNKNEYLKKLVTGFYNLQDIDVINYYKSICQLSKIEGINPFEYLTEKVVEAEPFIKFVEQAKETYNQYKIVCEQEKLNQYLSGLDVDRLSSLNAISFIKSDYDLTAYSSHLASLVDNYGGNIDGIRIIYKRLKEIERPVTKKLNNSQIHIFFNSTNKTDDFYYDLICMRISRLINFPSNLQSIFNPVLNSTENELIDIIAERIEYYISYGDILLNVGNMNYPLFNEVAKKLTEKSYGVSKIDIISVLQKYDTIKNTLAVDPNILLRRLNDLCAKSLANITTDNLNTIPVDFFEDAIGIKNNLTINCIEIARQYLNTKTKEDWKQAIVNNGYDAKLLRIIKLDIQSSFDAFKELLVDKAKGNCNNLPKEIVTDMIELFESNSRELLSAFNDVRDCFCGGGCEMTIDLFDFYGEWLLKYARLEDKAASLRTIFKPIVLDKAENIKWILKYQVKMKKIVEKAGEENKDFKDKVKSLLEGDYRDSDDFKKFAKTIGVELSLIDKAKGLFGTKSND